MEKLTQHQKILKIMLEHPEQEWFKAHEIMNLGEGETFVGYEASARLSEMAKRYPSLIESQGSGKYLERKLKDRSAEYMRSIYFQLPTAFQIIIRSYFLNQ